MTDEGIDAWHTEVNDSRIAGGASIRGFEAAAGLSNFEFWQLVDFVAGGCNASQIEVSRASADSVTAPIATCRTSEERNAIWHSAEDNLCVDTAEHRPRKGSFKRRSIHKCHLVMRRWI